MKGPGIDRRRIVVRASRAIAADLLPWCRTLLAAYLHRRARSRALGLSVTALADFHAARLSRFRGHCAVAWLDGAPVGFAAAAIAPMPAGAGIVDTASISHLQSEPGIDLVGATTIQSALVEGLLSSVGTDAHVIQARVPAEDVMASVALQNGGFRTVGSELELVLKPRPLAPPQDLIVRPVRDADAVQVVRIATNGHVHNRFARDPQCPDELAHDLYGAQLTAQCMGGPTRVLVATTEREPDTVLGFITFRSNRALQRATGHHVGCLDFIGVAHRARRTGIASILNRAALSELHDGGATAATVRTMITNYPAQRALGRLGAIPVASNTLFTLWPTRRLARLGRCAEGQTTALERHHEQVAR